MAIKVKIPAVGESISSGIVSVWHKKSGDFVDSGDALFTLETDKVSTEIVAEKSGFLETKVPEGEEVKIGEVVAIIDDSKRPPEEKKASPEGKKPEKLRSPAVRRIVEEEELEPEKIPGTGKAGRLTKADVLAAVQERGKAEEKIETRETQSSAHSRFTRKRMSPLRRKIAAQLVMAQQTAAILTTFNECDVSA